MTDNPLQQVNRTTLERVCKKLLQQLGLQPSPDCPYSLQLTLWGLENFELIGPWKADQSALLEQAKVMYNWKPDKVHQLLTDQISSRESLKLNPLQAATRMIENLYYWRYRSGKDR